MQNWKVKKDSKAKIPSEDGCLKCTQKWMARAPPCKEKA